MAMVMTMVMVKMTTTATIANSVAGMEAGTINMKDKAKLSFEFHKRGWSWSRVSGDGEFGAKQNNAQISLNAHWILPAVCKCVLIGRWW